MREDWRQVWEATRLLLWAVPWMTLVTWKVVVQGTIHWGLDRVLARKRIQGDASAFGKWRETCSYDAE